jgi:hypothetical protein
LEQHWEKRASGVKASKCIHLEQFQN